MHWHWDFFSELATLQGNRLPALRRFWATVLQAGNALNSGSMANTTERGFRLASTLQEHQSEAVL